MEPLVELQHCVLVQRGLPDSGTPRYNLFGVGYQYEVPADTEFPTDAAPPWAVYLRATGWNAGPTRILFHTHYRNFRGGWEHIFEREMDRSIPFPTDGVETHDVVLNLPYLHLGGPGLHALAVHFWYDGVELDGWNSEDADELFQTPDWAFGAAEYFWITRPL